MSEPKSKTARRRPEFGLPDAPRMTAAVRKDTTAQAHNRPETREYQAPVFAGRRYETPRKDWGIAWCAGPVIRSTDGIAQIRTDTEMSSRATALTPRMTGEVGNACAGNNRGSGENRREQAKYQAKEQAE